MKPNQTSNIPKYKRVESKHPDSDILLSPIIESLKEYLNINDELSLR